MNTDGDAVVSEGRGLSESGGAHMCGQKMMCLGGGQYTDLIT